MNRIWTVGAGLILLAGSVAPPLFSQAPSGLPVLHMTGARIRIDGKIIKGSFTITQKPFGFIYIHSPAYGAFIISNKPFPGAAKAGMIESKHLQLQTEGVTVQVDSATPLLDGDSVPIWVRFDQSLRGAGHGVAVGYGGTEQELYESLRRAHAVNE